MKEEIIKIIIEVVEVCYPITIYIFVAFISYFSLKNHFIKKYGYFNKSIILKMYKFKRHTHFISLFYTYLILGIYFLVCVYFLPPPPGLKNSVSVGFTIFLGIWAILIAYNVLIQQREQIVSFEDFLVELTDALTSLLQKAKQNHKKTFNVYIYDYHPLIGNLSSVERFKIYKETLDEIRAESNIHISIISNHEDSLDSFFKRLSIDSDEKIVDISFQASDYIRNFESSHLKTSVWKTSKIGQFHFFIVNDTAFHYVVIPDKGQNNHNIYGIKSEDPFIIDYLVKTFEDKQLNCISPTNIEAYNDEFIIYFEPQVNIKTIVLYDGKGREITNVKYKDFKVYSDDQKNINGFKIKEHLLKDYPISLRLIKDNGVESPVTRNIFYREFLEAKEFSKNVYYIHPSKQLHDKVSSCLDKLIEINLGHKIIGVTIFFNSSEISEEYINKEFNIFDFPILIVHQHPEFNICLEVIYVNKEIEVSYNKNKFFSYSTIEYQDHSEHYVISNDSNKSSLSDSINDVLDNFNSLLKDLETTYEFVARQWNYIGNIIETRQLSNDHDNVPIPNYQIFNRERAKIFDSIDFGGNGYPVATGIGMYKDEGYKLAAFVLPGSDVKVLKIDFQINPYNYSQNVLEGGKFPPLFERGKIVSYSECTNSYHFVSGTASIDGEESYTGNNSAQSEIQLQLNQTIKSLNAILRSSDGKSITMRNLSYARIYYAKNSELGLIKDYLNPLIKEVPHIYLQTDICRKDLYVEIEGGRF